MSGKDRQKKDGRNKDKKNQAAPRADNTRQEKAVSPQQAKDASNLTDREAGAATSNRKKA